MNRSLVTEEFLDTYEGEVLFLSQDMECIADEILHGDLKQETLELLEQKLEDVSDVFLSSAYTQDVSPVFKNFADYVSHIECSDFIQFEDVKKYLSEIVTDINTYINLYFVERTFCDVYVFHDSLQNSIEFLQRIYSCRLGGCDEDDGSELEFFND